MKAVKAGNLDVGESAYTPTSAISFSEAIAMLRKYMKGQDKEIRRLKEENEFLEEVSTFSQSAVGSQQKLENEISGFEGKRWQDYRKNQILLPGTWCQSLGNL